MQLISLILVLITYRAKSGLLDFFLNDNIIPENEQYFRYSGWLPEISILHDWKRYTDRGDGLTLSPAVQQLRYLIFSNLVIGNLTNDMINQWNAITQDPSTPELNCNITSTTTPTNLCNITTIDDFVNGINYVHAIAPPFHGEHLIGVPMAAFFTGFDSTLAGQTLFRIAAWNVALQNILKEWNVFLSSSDSNYGFGPNGDWRRNKDAWNYTIWAKDNYDDLKPWYNSWNSFFTRQFANRQEYRPIARATDLNAITSCNDGALFRWRKQINRTDSFYFKDMRYSLTDIFKSSDAAQQKKLDGFKLVERFTNGTIFQTFLDPFNFHRWWSAVNGTVVFDPIVIDSSVMFYSKLDLPDYQGSTTNSCPYLLQVNARGIICVDTTNYGNFGHVCMIPIGMVEVSTIRFAKGKGDIVNKGEEIGMFQFGGSSFAILLEDLSKYNKAIIYQYENGTNITSNPPLPNPNGDAGGEVIVTAGSQIAIIKDLFN